MQTLPSVLRVAMHQCLFLAVVLLFLAILIDLDKDPLVLIHLHVLFAW